MGGGTGPPMRGTPGNGGGPLGAILTLPSSTALAGEELLELLFTTGAGPGSVRGQRTDLDWLWLVH